MDLKRKWMQINDKKERKKKEEKSQFFSNFVKWKKL